MRLPWLHLGAYWDRTGDSRDVRVRRFGRRVSLLGYCSSGLCVCVLSACSGSPSAVDRAELQYLVKQPGLHGLTGVSCDERGGPITVRGVTYRGYMCALHGGGTDGADKATWWDGGRIYASCTDLPSTAMNALCFD